MIGYGVAVVVCLITLYRLLISYFFFNVALYLGGVMSGFKIRGVRGGMGFADFDLVEI